MTRPLLFKSSNKYGRVGLDDADLVGDLECVEVLGETYVSLLLTVRPEKKKSHTHTQYAAVKSAAGGSMGRREIPRQYVSNSNFQ